MVQTRSFRIRLTKAQHEKVTNNAFAKGYVSIAVYLRNLALNDSDFIENKLVEINNAVKKILEKLE